VPAVSTIWRILSRRGFVAPQPQKRPRSSWKMFCADQPNERWQADITHWGLADGAEVEILNILDDHSRLCLATGCPADHQGRRRGRQLPQLPQQFHTRSTTS
jgi:transposase InsO family protein